jgi:hypothetical protein
MMLPFLKKSEAGLSALDSISFNVKRLALLTTQIFEGFPIVTASECIAVDHGVEPLL